ncbi:MAG: TraR/DksA C4-type zinc finger protein [Bryobacteraceae bacterium]
METILNIEEYKQRLQEEEQQLLKGIDRADANARNLSEGSSVRDWSDASVRDEEKDEQFQTADIDLTTLKQVRDALKRIEEGTFGKCLVDGGPIEEKRLEAVPWVPYCVKHEQLLEKENPHQFPTL